MNLQEALTAIAEQLDLDAGELWYFAVLDTVGGYEPGNPNTPWSVGSMFGVEGQVLYALTRALFPDLIGEFGTHDGCSATHFLAAIDANNRHGRLISVDPWEGAGSRIPAFYRGFMGQFFMDGIEYLLSVPDASFDILFEDMMHSVEQVRDWWMVAQRKIKPGGLIISHDAAHFLVGNDVRRGIAAAGVSDAQVYLIEPSDCGLAIWRAPMAHDPEQWKVTYNDESPSLTKGVMIEPVEPPVKKPTRKRKPKAAK